jgi:hypothetical protein
MNGLSLELDKVQICTYLVRTTVCLHRIIQRILFHVQLTVDVTSSTIDHVEVVTSSLAVALHGALSQRDRLDDRRRTIRDAQVTAALDLHGGMISASGHLVVESVSVRSLDAGEEEIQQRDLLSESGCHVAGCFAFL